MTKSIGSWRCSVWPAAVFLCCGGLVAAGVEEGRSKPAIAMRWALGARSAGGSELQAIVRDTKLESGTRLKFLVEPLAQAAVYLILHDSSGDLHVLQRVSAAAPAGGGPVYVPAGDQWFEVNDTPGLETFFLLASSEPLAELDRLLDEHAAADPAKRRSLGPSIVAEIRAQMKAHRDFARPTEKPVVIGGQTRGEPAAEELDQLAVEVAAGSFYSKAITIDHQD